MIPTSSNQFSHPDSSFLSKCVTNFRRVRQSPVHTALSEAMTFIPGRENADRMLTFVGELREIRKCNLVCRTKTCCINLQDRLCFFLGVSMLSGDFSSWSFDWGPNVTGCDAAPRFCLGTFMLLLGFAAKNFVSYVQERLFPIWQNVRLLVMVSCKINIFKIYICIYIYIYIYIIQT